MQPEELALSPVGAALSGGDWFEAMFRDHYPRLVAVLTRLTGDRGQAEEIASDTFSKLARRAALLRNQSERMAWMYRVATNAGLDAVRANSRRRKKEAAAGVEGLRVGSQSGALEDLLSQERCARVRSVLSALKPRDAELLLLRSSGLPYREIAQMLGVQAGSVGTFLARAEREFEQKYRTRYGEEV